MEQPTGSKLGKEYVKAVLSVLLFNLYAEYNMQNAGLDESQAGIKISGRNIKNLGYADDTTLMGESEEELKGLLMSVKEESEKTGLKLNIQKSKIMASGPITSWKREGGKVEVAATAAAKSLQSCPTLCGPIDSGPPGPPVPGILQARTLEWVAISFSNA